MLCTAMAEATGGLPPDSRSATLAGAPRAGLYDAAGRRLRRPNTIIAVGPPEAEYSDLDVLVEIMKIEKNVKIQGLYKDVSADNVHYVTIESSNHIVQIIEKQHIDIKGSRVELCRADGMEKMFVELRGVPLEVPDINVRKALEEWFEVEGIQRQFHSRKSHPLLQGIQNGTRRAEVNAVIRGLPAAVRILGQTFKVHFFAPPEQQRCFNCWRCGHTKSECGHVTRCRYCFGEEHGTRDCPINPGRLARQQREQGPRQVAGELEAMVREIELELERDTDPSLAQEPTAATTAAVDPAISVAPEVAPAPPSPARSYAQAVTPKQQREGRERRQSKSPVGKMTTLVKKITTVQHNPRPTSKTKGQYPPYVPGARKSTSVPAKPRATTPYPVSLENTPESLRGAIPNDPPTDKRAGSSPNRSGEPPTKQLYFQA